MSTLSAQYDPKQHEEAVYAQWEKSGAFQPNAAAIKAGRKPFVIMLPPPNITGSLHMGHALQDVIMDILSRYHRMLGDPVLWQPGTDHAALPTNKIIVDQLTQAGLRKEDIGREEFMKRTQAWYDKTEAEILRQMKRLGSSCDWSRQRFTMDEAYNKAVQEAFIRYFKAGYIYRGARIVNWDPTTQTTVSDLEIDYKTESAPFYYLQYGPFEIGTARPETKFGDKYVVVHPDDERYARFKHGEQFEAEWINGPITATIIKDEAADPAIGSGAMTITPWHSVADFEIAQRHKLDMEQIIGFDGKLLPVAGEFVGLPIEEARPPILAKLQAKGLLLRVDETYEHNIALNDRGKGVIEPQVMRQWFVDMQKLKGGTIAVVEKDLVQFVPPRWKKHFLTWMHQVRDWNINRQIWLGHRLPVWWKPGTHGTNHEEGNFVVSLEKPGGLPADLSAEALREDGSSGEGSASAPSSGETQWEQDPDVLDTWFSSALWPIATLGWPQATEDLQTFYPTSVLVTARDILYLWVARMIFSGLELIRGEQYGNRALAELVPFRDVFIHPTVLTKAGQRMSKSLGTGVDPLDLVDTYGADATRFGLMHQMNYDSQAIKFDEEAIKASRNFANKVWNIARLLETIPQRSELTPADQWIEESSQELTGRVSQLLDSYQIGEAARAVQEFIWKEYADWYMEILKVEGSSEVAARVFDQLLTLLHPFMPHVTEVIWQQRHDGEMMMSASWPPASAGRVSGEAARGITRFKDVVSTARSARVLLGIPVKETITLASAGELPLPQSLERLVRASIVQDVTPEMKQFPVAAGQPLWMISPSMNEERLEEVRRKLQSRQEKLSAVLQQQQKIMTQMSGKAPAEKIAEKEAQLKRLQAEADELTSSLKLLE